MINESGPPLLVSCKTFLGSCGRRKVISVPIVIDLEEKIVL
jgi:hypothetical protein